MTDDAKTGASFTGKRALIIDDSRASAAMAAAVLEAAGWEIETARDGFEAIIRLRRQAYTLVLLDYRLPGMDGVEIMEWICRNLDKPPEVIVLSSDAAPMLIRKFSGLGVKAILSKPVEARELCRVLEG